MFTMRLMVFEMLPFVSPCVKYMAPPVEGTTGQQQLCSMTQTVV